MTAARWPQYDDAAWNPADDRAVAFYLAHTTPDGRARPARIDPDLSRLDRMDRGVPVDDLAPGDAGIAVMVAVIACLLVVLVATQVWRWA